MKIPARQHIVHLTFGPRLEKGCQLLALTIGKDTKKNQAKPVVSKMNQKLDSVLDAKKNLRKSFNFLSG